MSKDLDPRRLTFTEERVRATLYALVLKEQGWTPQAIVAAVRERYPRVQINFRVEERPERG